jgi:hypothetical protein
MARTAKPVKGKEETPAKTKDKPPKGMSAISPESLKAKFADPVKDPKIKELVDLLYSRKQESVTRNYSEARVNRAIDDAYAAPFCQITPTIVARIMRGCPANNDAAVTYCRTQLAQWGLSEDTLFNVSADGKATRSLKRETFWRILVPLVKAYVTVRDAKLFAEWDQYPLFVYSPTVATEPNRAQSEIITTLIQNKTAAYGYAYYLQQLIHQCNMYAEALMFPLEVWHTEEQATESGDKHAVREGLRYAIPHRSKIGWDRFHPAHTLNTDTGCEWAMYWDILRYAYVRRLKMWNLDKISWGRDWLGDNPTSGIPAAYFNELYPCVLKHPLRIKQEDRVENAAYYTTAHDDAGVSVAQMFCKLIPSEWNLGDYEHPVWFRFVLASDTTVIWAEPFKYAPVRYCGFECDSNHDQNSSFALEAIPWQDHLGNSLSQIILAIKQNAFKVIWFDKDQMPEAELNRMEKESKEISGAMFVPFSSDLMKRRGLNPQAIFTPVSFTLQNVAEMTANIGTMLNIMERVLGISALEQGVAASHEQTGEEIRALSAGIGTRTSYTLSSIGRCVDAWKIQLVEAESAYADEEFLVQVNGMSEAAVKSLKERGFEAKPEADGKYEVTGSKKKLGLRSFVSTREGRDRVNNPQLAQVMMQFLQSMIPMVMQPMTDERRGIIRKILELAHRAARAMGVPQDYKLDLPPPAKPSPENDGRPPEDAKEYLNINLKDMPPDAASAALRSVGYPSPLLEQAAVAAASAAAATGPQGAEQIVQAVQAQVAQDIIPIAEEVAALKRASGEQGALLQEIQGLLAQLGSIAPPAPLPQASPPPVGLPPMAPPLEPEMMGA